jgi:hypothetical protein
MRVVSFVSVRFSLFMLVLEFSRSDLVGWATKAAIFTDLAHRSLIHEMEARAVVDSTVFGYLAQMLGSPNAGAQRCSCDLLTSLVAHQSTRTTILELNHCVRLVSLLQ